MGRLTTHVLDTANGCPAADVEIEVFRLEAENHRYLKTVRTNADGRTDEPLLEGEAFVEGVYEVFFGVGGYFLQNSPFLDRVPVRFVVADASEHYHVPLLVSPYAYSTYRGN